MKLQFIPSAMSIFASKMVMFLNKRVIFPSNMSIFLSKYWFYLFTIVIFSSKNVVFRSNKHGDFPINNIPFHIKKCSFHTHADLPIKHCPHPVPLRSFRHSCFGPKTSPSVSQQFFACIFMYLHLVSMSRLHPSSLNNFLHSSCFNIELSLPPMCLSISCIHFASYVDFRHWPLHHFLRFCCFNIRTSPASTTSCMHLVSISTFLPPCTRPKKTCTGSKKEGAKVQKHPAQCERL